MMTAQIEQVRAIKVLFEDLDLWSFPSLIDLATLKSSQTSLSLSNSGCPLHDQILMIQFRYRLDHSDRSLSPKCVSMPALTTPEPADQYQPSNRSLVYPWFPPVVAERCHNDPSATEYYFLICRYHPSPMEMHKSYPN